MSLARRPCRKNQSCTSSRPGVVNGPNMWGAGVRASARHDSKTYPWRGPLYLARGGDVKARDGRTGKGVRMRANGGVGAKLKQWPAAPAESRRGRPPPRPFGGACGIRVGACPRARGAAERLWGQGNSALTRADGRGRSVNCSQAVAPARSRRAPKHGAVEPLGFEQSPRPFAVTAKPVSPCKRPLRCCVGAVLG